MNLNQQTYVTNISISNQHQEIRKASAPKKVGEVTPKQVTRILSQREYQMKHKKLLEYTKMNQLVPILKSGFIYNAQDLNILDTNQLSPLFYAVKHKNTSMIAWLISIGADVNLRCQNGMTAYHIAFQTDFNDAIIQLNQSGGNLNIVDNFGRTPLAYGTEKTLRFFALEQGVATVENPQDFQYDNNKLWFRKKMNIEPAFDQNLKIRQNPLKIRTNRLDLLMESL